MLSFSLTQSARCAVGLLHRSLHHCRLACAGLFVAGVLQTFHDDEYETCKGLLEKCLGSRFSDTLRRTSIQKKMLFHVMTCPFCRQTCTRKNLRRFWTEKHIHLKRSQNFSYLHTVKTRQLSDLLYCMKMCAYATTFMHVQVVVVLRSVGLSALGRAFKRVHVYFSISSLCVNHCCVDSSIASAPSTTLQPRSIP